MLIISGLKEGELTGAWRHLPREELYQMARGLSNEVPYGQGM